MRTLSTGEKHPLAECTAVLEHILREEFRIAQYSIRICGNYVGILFFDSDDDENDLVVWSWKTGVQNLLVSIISTHVMIGSPTGSFVLEVLSIYLTSFVFLDDNLILGSSCQTKQPALLVYRLEQRPDNGTGTTQTSTHLLRFLLGDHFQSPRGFSIIMLTSDPSPGWLPNAVPFHTDSDERIIAISSKFIGSWDDATYLIYAKALLRQIESLSLEEGLDVDWELHRPPLIELVPKNFRHPSLGWNAWLQWPYPVFGMRYVLPGVEGLDNIPKVLIRDLSPGASKEEREDSDALYEMTGWRNPGDRGIRSCEPNPRSILTRVPLPGNIHLERDSRFLMSEDGIIIVENVRETPAFSKLRDSYG